MVKSERTQPKVNNLSILYSYCKVIEAGSIRSAAENLFISQAAVSKQMKTLERELGFVLLERNSRGIHPTKLGMEVYHHAMEVLKKASELEAAIQQYSETPSGKIRLCASATIGNYTLPAIISDLKKAHPNIRVVVDVATTERVYESVSKGESDMAIAVAYRKMTGMKIQPLFSEELNLVVASSDPLAYKTALTAEDLNHQFFILPREGSPMWHLTLSQLKLLQVVPKNYIHIEYAESIKDYIIKHGGTGILYRPMIEKEIARGDLVPLRLGTSPMKGYVYMVYKSEREVDLLLQTFIRFLQEKYNAFT